MEHSFDVIVLGAGPAGEVAAGRIAEGGRRTAIVEGHLIGGECSFYACMPSKALLRAQEALDEARRVPGAEQAICRDIDVAAVLARRDEVIHNGDDASYEPWLTDRGVSVFRGWGRLDGERRVPVGDDVLMAEDAVVVAVGSSALFPPIPGLAEVGAWSNREITNAKQVPERLLVLGGGVVGVEMAQAWSWLGSQVTVVEASERLISREEAFASEAVAAALRETGVKVHLGSRAESVRREDGEVSVGLEGGETFSGDHLLVAIGRKPMTSELGLESIGVSPGRGGYLEVDDHLRVPGAPWLYAVGDVNGRSLLTHSGKYQARVAADNVLGTEAVAWADQGRAPRVIFTEPQVAAVGLSLEQARADGVDAIAVDLPTDGSAGASFYGHGTGGTTRFVVDREREVLVGVTFVGAEIQDFLQAATFAVVGEIPLQVLAHGVAPFPTRSELWLGFIEAYEKERGGSLHAGAGTGAGAGANARAGATTSS